MKVDTPALFMWWQRWCDKVRYPETHELLSEIYAGRKISWNTHELNLIFEAFRQSQKPVPLLWEDVIKHIIPHYYNILKKQKMII